MCFAKKGRHLSECVFYSDGEAGKKFTTNIFAYPQPMWSTAAATSWVNPSWRHHGKEGRSVEKIIDQALAADMPDLRFKKVPAARHCIALGGKGRSEPRFH